MLIYCPEALSPSSPLVVVLHGCTQTAEAFASDSGWLTLADRLGFAVLAPQQTSANNPNRCFNWFETQDMRRGAGEPASIAAMIRHALDTHDLDASRVYIVGLSAGGAMTAVMLAAYPDVFAGGAIIAGAPYGTAHGVPQALQAMQGRGSVTTAQLASLLERAGAPAGALPRLSIWHGDADHVVNATNGAAIARQWAGGQGLAESPTEMTPAPGVLRSVWRDSGGAVRIELNRVRGLGHGVPLETRGEAALGRAAPFMLQAGVSSTWEIARFWGLAPAGQIGAMEVVQHVSPPLAADPGDRPMSRPHVQPEPAAAFAGVGSQVMSAVAAVPSEVQAIIAQALTRAGLLR